MDLCAAGRKNSGKNNRRNDRKNDNKKRRNPIRRLNFGFISQMQNPNNKMQYFNSPRYPDGQM